MRPGQYINDRYRIDERIAAGGMGEVWRGHDDRLHRTVAVKVLHNALASDVVFQSRFHIEARAIAALHHPGVVNIYDVGEQDDPDGPIVYLVMEYVDGRSLQQVISADGRLGVEETLRIVAATAEALAVAHRAQIIHRDVKPGNILIDRAGAPRLVDFGIARTAGGASLTNTGMVMGTTAYVAPEQLHGDDPTPSADIYSLGVVAYQCLTGRKPFDGDLPAAVIANALHSPPPPLPEDVPAEVAAVVLRALAKEPEERWADATAFAAACRDPQAAPVTPPAEGETTPPGGDVVVTPTASQPPPDDEELTPQESARQAAPESEAGHGRGRTRTLVSVIVFLLVLLLGAGGYLLYLRPWDFTETGTRDDAMGTEEVGDLDSADESSESPSPSESESEADPSDPPESSSESSSEEPTSGEVPPLDGLEQDEAEMKLDAAGFTNYSMVYEGDGAKVCNVWRQEPEAYEVHEFDDKVTAYIQTVDNLEDCRFAGAG